MATLVPSDRVRSYSRDGHLKPHPLPPPPQNSISQITTDEKNKNKTKQNYLFRRKRERTIMQIRWSQNHPCPCSIPASVKVWTLCILEQLDFCLIPKKILNNLVNVLRCGKPPNPFCLFWPVQKWATKVIPCQKSPPSLLPMIFFCYCNLNDLHYFWVTKWDSYKNVSVIRSMLTVILLWGILCPRNLLKTLQFSDIASLL